MSVITAELNFVQRLLFPIINTPIRDRPALMLVIILMSVVLLTTLFSDTYSIITEFENKLKTDNFGLLLELATLFVIIGVWYADLRREWCASLKKYLTVEFKYDDKVQARCEFAPLIGEFDARAMALSIGQCMNEGERLDIAPMLSDIRKKILIDCSYKNETLVNDGLPFMYYVVTVCLTGKMLPPGGNSEKIAINEGEYLLWMPPFASLTKKDIKKIHDSSN